MFEYTLYMNCTVQMTVLGREKMCECVGVLKCIFKIEFLTVKAEKSWFDTFSERKVVSYRYH